MGNNISVQKIQYLGIRILSNTVIHFTNVILIGHKIFLAFFSGNSFFWLSEFIILVTSFSVDIIESKSVI